MELKVVELTNTDKMIDIIPFYNNITSTALPIIKYCKI